MKEAIFYKREKNFVQCYACNHKCKIKKNLTGICAVRKNINNRLFLLNYGKIVSESVDPIEKKPLYHFLPNTKTYSICAVGCNFKCEWCQNFHISQASKEGFIFGRERKPEEIVKNAIMLNCPSISYTYTEPTVWSEFVLEVSRLAKKEGLKNIWVTNGYFSKECLNYFSKEKLIDAMNIDLKCFKEETYQQYCGAKLKNVLKSIKEAHKFKIHLEITTLLIPKINDSVEEIRNIAKFIFSLDKKGKIPWHISRFFPMYKFAGKEHIETPLETLKKAYEIGKEEGLKFVYIGNI
ncbi:MAG: AmmeMemoRadiSam system radical SAM enzyme [Candidatus Pacearchaeota archaeon]